MTYMLEGIRVVEVGDPTIEYAGMVLASLGAEVIKVEPPEGSPSRRIGPYVYDVVDPERSLFFWAYNRNKLSVAWDLERSEDMARLSRLVGTCDVLLDSTERGWLEARGLSTESLMERFPHLTVARLTPFGDDGPWADFKGSDLVQLALGGQMMNSGYDPRPDGTYDLPPIAGQAWQSCHIAGEQLVVGVLAALIKRDETSRGDFVTCAIHEAAAKNTELDVMTWVMRRAELKRQTARHAGEQVGLSPPLVQTKDGRWIMALASARDSKKVRGFLEAYGMAGDLEAREHAAEVGGRQIPGSGGPGGALVQEDSVHLLEVVQRLFRKFTYEEAPWREAQAAGMMFAPVRRPEENLSDEHWIQRATFQEVDHPEIGRPLLYPVSKWISTETQWRNTRRAPLLNEDAAHVNSLIAKAPAAAVVPATPQLPARERERKGLVSVPDQLPLKGIRVFDFSWFLASAGGTRFLAALGAEVLKVEWAAHPDTRRGCMAPVGGREARRVATGPLPSVDDPDMGGQFNNKNAGKLGISLNVRDPRGMEIAQALIAKSDIVAEGFSPGVMDRWGLGYDKLQELRPDIIYAQQSGMGGHGIYGRLRAVGPIAASLAGLTEMSGMPEPAPPAGWGYSYLDWIGAYSFGEAILSAIFYRNRTGQGQWIDASQTETGIFSSGVPILDYVVNGRDYKRSGNRSPWQKAAPHGAFPCAGEDHWIAISCFTDDEWRALVKVADHPEWDDDPRFADLASRVRNQKELERLVTAWTCTSDRYDLMYRLQDAGVPAGVCQTGEDKVDNDPQLDALGWLVEVTGTKIGKWPVGDISFRMKYGQAQIGLPMRRGAPCYGEDNEYVYGELLGLTTAEIGRLAADGVI